MPHSGKVSCWTLKNNIPKASSKPDSETLIACLCNRGYFPSLVQAVEEQSRDQAVSMVWQVKFHLSHWKTVLSAQVIWFSQHSLVCHHNYCTILFRQLCVERNPKHDCKKTTYFSDFCSTLSFQFMPMGNCKLSYGETIGRTFLLFYFCTRDFFSGL